jgi:hypothetical protein
MRRLSSGRLGVAVVLGVAAMVLVTCFASGVRTSAASVTSTRRAVAAASTGRSHQYGERRAAPSGRVVGVQQALLRPVRGRRGGAKGVAAVPRGVGRLLSDVIGSSLRSYWAYRRGSSVIARNQRQHFTARYSRSGLVVSVAGETLRLALRRVVMGSGVRMIGARRLGVAANRLQYRYQGVTETDANGPMGIEQTFRVAAPAHGHPRRLTPTTRPADGLRRPARRATPPALTRRSIRRTAPTTRSAN